MGYCLKCGHIITGESVQGLCVSCAGDALTKLTVGGTTTSGDVVYMELPVIPEDADRVHAEWRGGERPGLSVSWYAEPKDTPEWYGKDLGFCVRLDLEDGWGQRLARLINELWERVEK